MTEYSCQNDHSIFPSRIDELIQNSQLNPASEFQFIEWIEYINLANIEFVAHGGFGSVYRAVWKDGPITAEGPFSRFGEYRRFGNFEVAIKKFRNVIQVNLEFLNEVNKF